MGFFQALCTPSWKLYSGFNPLNRGNGILSPGESVRSPRLEVSFNPLNRGNGILSGDRLRSEFPVDAFQSPKSGQWDSFKRLFTGCVWIVVVSIP